MENSTLLVISRRYEPLRSQLDLSAFTKVGLSVDGDVEDVTVHLEVVYHSITAMPEYSGKSFEELRLAEVYQEGRDWGNRLRRVCADCGRSLTRENYSNTQLKKRVGDSRCKDCVVRVWPT